MLHIFIISNDIRIEKLIQFFQPFFKTKIRRAGDFDQGLQEVFENRPSVVFIQSTIGSVSGETVARHIKSLLGSASPKIIFLGEDSGKTGRKTTWCDDWICISDSEQELRRDFSKLLSEYCPQDWLEISREMERTPSRQTDAVFGSEDIPPVAEAAESGGPSDGAQPAPVQSDTGIPAETAGASESGTVQPEAEDDTFEIFPGESAEYPEFPATPEFPHGRERISVTLRLVFLILFLLIVAGGWFLFRKTQESRSRHPAATAGQEQGRSTPAPSAAAVNAGRAPSFIRGEWRDPDYSASHPGWERYLSPDHDFRLFREKHVLKALQVIARGNGRIRDGYFASVLGEFALPIPQAADSVEKKDGVLVERTTLAGTAELVVYKSESDGRIQAFVLAFP